MQRRNERVAGHEHDAILEIEAFLGVDPIRVEPRTVGVPFNIEQVRVAIGVRNV